jgi:hypothetical protein
MEIEIFETADGFGYRVGGVYQEFDPDLDGFVPMTRARAEECAEIIRQRLIE